MFSNNNNNNNNKNPMRPADQDRYSNQSDYTESVRPHK